VKSVAGGRLKAGPLLKIKINDMNSNNPDDMKTLASVLSKIVKEGYEENFKVTDKGLQSLETEKIYAPDQVHIVNFFRFEVASDPSDSAILYVIETSDRAKGSLTDAYGMYADPEIDKFIKDVEDISKKHAHIIEEPH
jgi:hypothetical protein